MYSTNEGMAPEARKFHKKVAHMTADKTHDSCSDMINVVKTKLSFAMLNSVLLCLCAALDQVSS